SASAAALVVGGKTVLTRGYELGGNHVERWGRASVGQGKVRVVARVGSNGEGSRVRLSFFAEDGSPLVSHAPKPGEAASIVAGQVEELAFKVEHASEPERALVAAAWLEQGDARSAEHLLETGARAKDAGPLVALLYARAIDQAGDLPETRAIERARDALETT